MLPPIKPKRRKWKWFLILVLLGFALAGAATMYLSKANQIFTNKGNILNRVSQLFISPDKPLIGEDQGIVNVLLMGIGGEGHEGAHLTDTMIIASIDIKTNEVTLISIPRDFALDLPKVGFNRINAAYAYAYKDDPNTAGNAAIEAAEKVTGLSIPYYAVIDFKGFVKAIDHIGGVDVTIDRTFTDYEYPDEKYGYLSPVTFTKGAEHMDGARALIFARSRKGNNNEGSDFARSERQKKIITAFKDKVIELNLTDLKTMNNLLSDFTENFRTNLEPFELKRLGDLAMLIKSDNMYSFSLEPQDNLICSDLVDAATGKSIPPAPTPAPTDTPPTTTPQTSNQDQTNTDAATEPAVPEIIRMYIVGPCRGKTLADIHAYLVNAPMLAKLRKEGAVIEIQNSVGPVSITVPWQRLSELGMDIKFVGFKGKVAYDQTIFYDNSKGGKPNTLEYLKNNFEFQTSDVGFPSSSADFVVVLGKDAL